MNTLGASILVVAIGLASCDSNGDDVQVEDSAAVDTSLGMPRGMAGGMGSMAGMDAGMMASHWAQHMAAMQASAGDSLQSMMPMHRQMASNMLEMMDSAHGGMGMAMDSAWRATRDSLRRDLDRMEGMGPGQMGPFLREHDARMRRMLQLHQSTPQQAP